MSGVGSIQGRIDTLTRRDDTLMGRVTGADWYEFRVSPSCPPDKRLHMRGGRNYLSWNRDAAAWDYAEYRCYTVPDLIADLSDYDSVLAVPSWSNAYWYQLFVLGLRIPAVAEEPTISDWSFYLLGTGDEFETAAEAEAWVNSQYFLLENLWDTGAVIGSLYSLCGVVLRNDGTVGVEGAFLPIDVVNRGRSYMWPPDLRPRQSSGV